MDQTAAIREAIPPLLKEFNVRTMLDAPCGDFFWIPHMALPIDKYFGVDIVKELIAQNTARNANESRTFLCLDLVHDRLPASDLILCRDCLVHLNNEQARKALLNFKRSGAKYLLTTTFTDRSENVDLDERRIWRTLNLQIAPFNFPKPLRVVNEVCPEADGAYADKSLALWALQDIELK